MKESINFIDSSVQDVKLKTRLVEAGFDVMGALDGTIEASSSGVHTLQLAVNTEEIIVDYIESNSLESGAGSYVVGILKELAEESGKVLRASTALPDAVGFWETQGFEKDGNDYVYEA